MRLIAARLGLHEAEGCEVARVALGMGSAGGFGWLVSCYLNVNLMID